MQRLSKVLLITILSFSSFDIFAVRLVTVRAAAALAGLALVKGAHSLYNQRYYMSKVEMAQLTFVGASCALLPVALLYRATPKRRLLRALDKRNIVKANFFLSNKFASPAQFMSAVQQQHVENPRPLAGAFDRFVSLRKDSNKALDLVHGAEKDQGPTQASHELKDNIQKDIAEINEFLLTIKTQPEFSRQVTDAQATAAAESTAESAKVIAVAQVVQAFKPRH